MINIRNSNRTEREMRCPHARRGQALVEFAVVGLVLYMLLAAILTFGHALYVAQGLQTAADLGAREISRAPIEAFDSAGEATTLEGVLSENALLNGDDLVRRQIFDEALLVIDLEEFYAATPDGNVFQDIVPNMPVLNQQLVSMMIVDRPTLTFDMDGTPEVRTFWLLRYPGALLHRNSTVSPPSGVSSADFSNPASPSASATEYKSWVATDFTVGIPVVQSRAADGVERIRWVDVVEEIDSASNPDPFAITSPQRGLVALRINFPFQSASMSSFRHDENHPEYPFEPTIGRPNAADDDGVLPFPADPPDGTSLTDSQLTRTVQDPNDPTKEIVLYTGTYGGKYGLGAQGALGSAALVGLDPDGNPRAVRPYRRVISAQAIYRREVFE